MIKSCLILLCFLLFLPKLVFAHTDIKTIEMTANGFEPQQVSIDQGSTVIFINKDKSGRWPASNTHPTHDIYPEFDPRRTINPGESWPFKFEKAGEFKLHDHLFPHMRGTITVLPEEGNTTSAPDLKQPNLLDKIKDFFSGIYKGIKNLFTLKDKVLGVNFASLPAEQQIKAVQEMVEVQGAGKTWEQIKENFKGQGGNSGNIHDLAHLVGGLIYEREGFGGLSICSPDFAFGCYHGFLDKAFEKNLDNLLEAEKGCRQIGPGNSGPVASCIHGIGHGVASFYQTNDLESSLLTCDKLTSGNEYCSDGVFMEFARSAPENFYSKDNPLSPCDSLEQSYAEKYTFSCGRNQVTVMLTRLGYEFDGVVNACLNSSSTPFKQSCFDSLGFVLAQKRVANDIINGCNRISDPYFSSRCANAAAGELIFQEVPGWQENSVQICNSLSNEFKFSCHEHINRIITEYGKDVKKNFKLLKSGQDQNLYIRDQLKICYENGGRDGCYKEVAKLLFDQLGLKETLALLKENEGHPEVYARCHEVTHYLSRYEYEKQKNIAKVYAVCDSTCHGGCYHGTLEAYLKEKQLQPNSDLSSEFAKICGSEKDYQKPYEFNECLHGSGHAAMFVTDLELPQSLQLCDVLPTQDQKERCYSGVFMENSSSSTSNDHPGKYIKADDPFYPCNSLEEKYQPLCWQYQSSYFSILTKQNWAKVAELCLQIPEKYQHNCFKTIGTNQVGFTSSLQTMRDDCNLMPDPYKDVCVGGVISSLSYRFVGDSGKMIEFCSLVDGKNQEICFRQMGTSLMDWDKNKEVAKSECAKIPNPQAQSWCLSAI